MNDLDFHQTAAQELSALNRRAFLKRGLQVGVITYGAAVAGCTTIMGRPIPTKTAGIVNLTAQELRVFRQLRDALIPAEKYGLPDPQEIPVIENIDRMVGQLNPAVRGDLNLAIRLFDYSPIVTAYSFRTASYMKRDRLVKYVDNWQNGLFFQQGVMTTMKTAVYLAYWRDPRTWEKLGYDGPITEKWGIRRLGNAPLPEWG